MKVAYVGIDLLYSALDTLGQMQDIKILKIFTCPKLYEGEDSQRVVAFAQSHGIPYQMERVGEKDLKELAEMGCELLLCAGYYYRLPMTDAFPMVNVHPAPLPSHRGAWPMPYVLLWGEAQGGVTIHQMEATFDTGNILLEEYFPLESTDTLADYMAKSNAILSQMLEKLLKPPSNTSFRQALSAAIPQTEGRYLKNPTEEDWTITDQMTVEEADRILRAFYGYPCLYQMGNYVKEISFGRAIGGTPNEGELPLIDGKIVFSMVK